ncbi:MAG: hypothetical protein KGJ43_08315 [Acidobacteriota bacterium]|nr:hypothetical protein [Acidobacteriota bacterium]
MSQAESVELLRRGRSGEVRLEDLQALFGACTPHFALQLRERIRALIAELPAGHPARAEGEREIARLERLAFSGESDGEAADAGERPMPSLRQPSTA